MDIYFLLMYILSIHGLVYVIRVDSILYVYYSCCNGDRSKANNNLISCGVLKANGRSCCNAILCCKWFESIGFITIGDASAKFLVL